MVASAFLGGEPKVQWDSLPFQPPKPTDIVTKIEAGDQEELPEPEPEDGRVVQPPGPPIPSAIRGLSGEADGPRPVWSKPEGYKVEDGRIVAIAPDEARGYFRYIRSENSTEEVTDPPMWPPPPRKRGDLDFPSGPIPSVEIYGEHHIAETDKANAAWKEQFELHEAKQPKMKLIDMSDMSRRVPWHSLAMNDCMSHFERESCLKPLFCRQGTRSTSKTLQGVCCDTKNTFFRSHLDPFEITLNKSSLCC